MARGWVFEPNSGYSISPETGELRNGDGSDTALGFGT